MLTITQLSVARGETHVLHNLTLSLPPGSVQVLMGPNGSGKSTLAYTLLGYPAYTVMSGSIVLNGVDILSLPTEKRARQGLFLACQHPQEVPGVQVFTFLKEAHRMLTGLELGVPEFQHLLYSVLDKVKLDHSFAYRYLYQGFSGGEKKRLEIAQLLLYKPKIAILDEIDSGLDSDGIKSIAQVLAAVRTECPDTSILFITHYKRLIEYIAPEVVHVLAQGRLVRSGGQELVAHIEQWGYDALPL